MKFAIIFFSILGIIGTLLSLLVIGRFAYNLLTKQTPTAERKIDKTQLVRITSEVDEIVERQKEITDLYFNLPVSLKRKQEIFFDLLAPFGALDPIATNTNPDTKDIVNFQYGVYANRLYPDTNYAQYMVTRPIDYGINTFKPEEYFKKNSKKLDALALKTLEDKQIKVLAVWATDLYRFNNYSWDSARFFFWETKTDSTPYYQYTKVTISYNSPISDEFSAVLEKYNPTFDEMYAIEIQTIYSCGGNLIFIISGTVNNAVGLLYNGATPEDIRCGLLANKFNNIILTKKLSDKWIYWVTN